MNIEEYKKLANIKPARPLKNKYNAKTVIIDGIKFDSKKEAAYYQRLKLAKLSGELLRFDMQVPFEICKGRKYLLDFMETWKDGRTRYVDVKGYQTPLFGLKRAIVEEKYGIKIELV